MRYNDTSVLESIILLKHLKNYNMMILIFIKNFSPEEYRICRRRMIDGVLAIDMANHQKVLSCCKTLAESYNIKKEKISKMFLMKVKMIKV